MLTTPSSYRKDDVETYRNNTYVEFIAVTSFIVREPGNLSVDVFTSGTVNSTGCPGLKAKLYQVSLCFNVIESLWGKAGLLPAYGDKEQASLISALIVSCNEV